MHRGAVSGGTRPRPSHSRFRVRVRCVSYRPGLDYGHTQRARLLTIWPLHTGRPYNQPYGEGRNNKSNDDAEDGSPEFLARDCRPCHLIREGPSALRLIRVSPSSMPSLSSNSRNCCFKISSFLVSISCAILRQSAVNASFMPAVIHRSNYKIKSDCGIPSSLY